MAQALLFAGIRFKFNQNFTFLFLISHAYICARRFVAEIFKTPPYSLLLGSGTALRILLLFSES